MSQIKHRIMLVEDEPHLAFSLRYNLEAEGYDVTLATNGKEALRRYEEGPAFDLIIADVMMPEMDGFELVERIRKISVSTGILMLTARASEEDRIKGFKTGIDDYITKPFHLEELLLRIKRMLLRAELIERQETSETQLPPELPITSGPFALDMELLRLTGPAGDHQITALEAEILKEFMNNPKRVLSREYLLEKVWGMKSTVETRTVDNFIVRLRKYMERDPAQPNFLVSVRGRGYRFVDEPHAN